MDKMIIEMTSDDILDHDVWGVMCCFFENPLRDLVDIIVDYDKYSVPALVRRNYG